MSEITRVIVIESANKISTAEPVNRRYCDSEDEMTRLLRKLGYREVLVDFPKRNYECLKNRVRFMYLPIQVDGDCATDLIRRMVSKWGGNVVGHKWLITGEMKAYSSIPDHFHSGLGSLNLIEVL